MTGVAELLPVRSTTPFERALARAATDVLPIPMRESLSASSAPAAFLPFLAAHESVDLWFDDWSDDRKRRMINDALRLSSLKGTRAAAAAFLAYVDAILLDKVSYPTRFVFGRARIGRTPIGHPAYAARHLVKVETTKPLRALVLGRSALGRGRLRTPTREPFRRCRIAMAVAKAPSAEHRVDFAHMRHVRVSDAIPVNGTHRLGEYLNRIRL